MKPSRFEQLEAFTVLGCPQFGNPGKVCPGLAWERLNEEKEKNGITGAYEFEIGLEVYPSDFPGNGNKFYYMAGVPLKEHPSKIPFGLFAFSVPSSEYAVFELDGIDALPGAFGEIYHTWLPGSAYRSAHAYDFERYLYVPDFKVEIFIPVVKK